MIINKWLFLVKNKTIQGGCMVNQTQSSFGKLNITDWRKIGKGALIAIGGSLLAYLATVIANVNWGSYAYIAIPLAAIIINAGQKWLTGK